MRRDKLGRIVFREKNFKIMVTFLKYFWGANLFRFLIPRVYKLTIVGGLYPEKPHYPKNIWILIWGSVLGVVFCLPTALILSLFILLVAGILGWFFALVAVIVGFLLGFVFDFRKKSRDAFHPYRTYGKRNEKRLPLAPWHIWLPALVIWLLIRKDFLIIKAMAKAFSWVFWALTSSVGLIVLSGITVITFLVLFFRSTAGQVCRESIKATKNKIFPPIVIKK